ncbi:MAG: murein L,D-transpeptidase catalytic domain-containing protein [Chthoniobacterales bacterium]
MPSKPKLKPPTGTFTTIPPEVDLAFKERTKQGSTCTWIFEVDYSINSKEPRFFIFNIKTGALYKYKTAHGRGGKNESPHDGKCRQISNVSESGCSSVGAIRTLEPYTSGKVGKALRLLGLSDTNNKIEGRGVVLHGAEYVHDNNASTDTSLSGRSLGCIAVDEKYIHPTAGGELIDVLANGSIGVAHFAGKFKI